MTSILRISLMLLLALATTASVALADERVATNTFDGVADPGMPGFPIPIVLHCDDFNDFPMNCGSDNVKFTADSFGIRYTYSASGVARGDLPGKFTYVDHGFVYISFATGEPTGEGDLVFAVFALTPNQPGIVDEPITIWHDDTGELVSSGVTAISSKISDLRGVMGASKLGASRGASPRGGEILHQWFDFTADDVTYSGYANADWSRFSIQMTFSY